jgi:hypothetical protein
MTTKCLANGLRKSTTVNYETSTMRATKPRTAPEKTSGLLMGSKQFTRPKPCKLYSSAIVSKDDKFQDLPQLTEKADNTERYT